MKKFIFTANKPTSQYMGMTPTLCLAGLTDKPLVEITQTTAQAYVYIRILFSYNSWFGLKKCSTKFKSQLTIMTSICYLWRRANDLRDATRA